MSLPWHVCHRFLALGVLALISLSGAVRAQSIAADENKTLGLVSRMELRQDDLPFPQQALTQVGTQLADQLFKPEGDGPFPAVVLAQTCGALQSEDLAVWVKAALARGLVVHVPNSLRGYKQNCFHPTPVTAKRRHKDLLDASDALSRLPYVKPQQIFLIGFSQGAMYGAMLSSAKFVQAVKPGAQRFAGVVSLYGACFFDKGHVPGIPFGLRYLHRDLDRPFLALMSKGDVETPINGCDGFLAELKAQGKDVAWHVYDQATHCWDCKSLNGLKKKDTAGTAVEYRYDEAVTRDSIQRALDFIAARSR